MSDQKRIVFIAILAGLWALSLAGHGDDHAPAGDEVHCHAAFGSCFAITPSFVYEPGDWSETLVPLQPQSTQMTDISVLERPPRSN